MKNFAALAGGVWRIFTEGREGSEEGEGENRGPSKAEADAIAVAMKRSEMAIRTRNAEF